MRKFVAAIANGKLNIHASIEFGDYDTLCGMDIYDPALGHYPAQLPIGAKIDCHDCIAIWDACKKFRANEFKR